MGLMNKLFGHQEIQEVAQPELATLTSCPHTTLTPRWDAVEDMGKADRATGYHCEGCGRMFTPEEERSLRSNEAERVREAMPVE
jgi:methionyl-tRNA synthetase